MQPSDLLPLPVKYKGTLRHIFQLTKIVTRSQPIKMGKQTPHDASRDKTQNAEGPPD
jgi:hypothetical protein